MRCLVTDISYLDPQEGIRFRGKTIPETFAALPKVPGKEQPFVEGFFYFLLTGEIPTMDQTLEIVEDWKARATVPQYVFDVLRAMPRDSHPMSMFSAAIIAMQRESKFAKKYATGNAEEERHVGADVRGLDGHPRAAPRDRRVHLPDEVQGRHLHPGEPEARLGRQLRPHDGHRGSVRRRGPHVLHPPLGSRVGERLGPHAHLVASALSDAYLSLSAGINGLAGPLHGLANQEVLGWIKNTMKKLNNQVPTKEQLKQFLWDTLNSGQVIPGYGHAVLRKTDPRYIAQNEFAKKHLPNDPLFQLVNMIYEVAPGVLTEHGKTKNPWPNVDAHSGVIQVVLRRRGVGLLHGPLRHRPRARRARQPRGTAASATPSSGRSRSPPHAREVGGGGRPEDRK